MQLGEWALVWGLQRLVYVPLSLSGNILWEPLYTYLPWTIYIIICVSLRTVVLSMSIIYTYIAL